MSCSWATCWPVSVSRIQKSLPRSTMISSARWGVVFHYHKLEYSKESRREKTKCFRPWSGRYQDYRNLQNKGCCMWLWSCTVSQCVNTKRKPLHCDTNVKGKAVPLEACSCPEGSRKLRFPDFMTTAQDGGKVSLTHRPPLPPGNAPGTHFC